MFTLDCIFIIMTLRPPRSKRTDPLSPYTTLFRSSRCPLQDGKTIADYQMLIAKCVAAAPGDGAIYGIGWSDALFPPNGIPHKELLDAVTTTRQIGRASCRERVCQYV